MGDVESADELLEALEGYSPVIPDDLTEHFLHRSGFHSPSLHLTRLVSVSAHKFLAEVISDAMQYCKMRQATAGKDGGRPKGQQLKDRRLTLTTEDLAAALKEYGLNVKKPDFFVDGPLGPHASATPGTSRASVPPTGAGPASAAGISTGTVGAVVTGTTRLPPHAGSKAGLAHFSSSAVGADSADGYGL